MFGFFKKEKTDNNIYAPVNGKSLALEDVEDKVFASKVLGNGIAFIPEGNFVFAPCDGTIMSIADTKHAFGIKMDNGMEILIHVGLDTVSLNGDGFTLLKKVNDRVKHGDKLLKLDMQVMKAHNINLTIPVIVANDNECIIQIEKPTTGLKAGLDKVITVV